MNHILELSKVFSDTDLCVWHGENLAALQRIPDESVNLIYIDPPFNTGKVQSRTRLSDASGDPWLPGRTIQNHGGTADSFEIF